jgi:hypothetical protein
MGVEIRDVAPGLWLWRQPHPIWDGEDGDWEPEVASVTVESRGAAVVLDPLAPPPTATGAWARTEAMPPTAVLVLRQPGKPLTRQAARSTARQAAPRPRSGRAG